MTGPAMRITPVEAPGQAPVLRAPDKVHHIFSVTMAAACLPLLAGVLIFGYRAAIVAGVAVASCAALEWLYFRVTHTPAMLGRTHAYLTGLLLALTLPPFLPWYIVILAAIFTILLGKAIFGGVGHFIWHPALVGRLAVAVIVPVLFSGEMIQPETWPVLAQDHLLLGNVRDVDPPQSYLGWRDRHAPRNADGFALEHPAETIAPLTRGDQPAYSALARVRNDIPRRKPVALTEMLPLRDLMLGVRPGGIGETSAIAIIIAGMYLIYRNYIKWYLPFTILAAAGVVAAVAPIHLAGPNNVVETVWFPIAAEHGAVGFTYICYQLLSGELLLAAFFFATEMTSRPVTVGGQVIFGIGCGGLAMLMKLYVPTPIPAYVAVLIMNTFTPSIDTLWKPRVFGQRHFEWFHRWQLRRRARA